MKNAVLASLLLLGISNAFGVSVERSGISIQYEKCLKYRTIKFELPYCIKITNLSSKPITVGPSIISAPLVASQEVAKALRNEYKFGAMLGALSTAGAATILHYSKRDPNVVYNPKSLVGLGGKKIVYARDYSQLLKASMGVGGFLTAYLLYKLATETQKDLEAKLAKEVLYSPITIQPCQSIEKLFWLKNPNDKIVINEE